MKVSALIALAGVVEALTGHRGGYYPPAPGPRGHPGPGPGYGPGYGHPPVRAKYGRRPAPRGYDRGYNRGRIGRGYNRGPGPVGPGYNRGLGPVGPGYNRGPGPVGPGYNRGYGAPRGYNRGYGRPKGYNRGHGGSRRYKRGPIARGYKRVYRSPRNDYRKPKVDRAYDAIEIYGDNGKDYGFAQQKLKTTYAPGLKKNSFTKTFSSTSYGGSKSRGNDDFNNISKHVVKDAFGRNQGDQLSEIEALTDDFAETMGLGIGRKLSPFGALTGVGTIGSSTGNVVKVSNNMSDIESTMTGLEISLLNAA